MPQVLYPPARPQTVREVLDSGVLIFKATIGSTLSWAMLMSLAAELANLRNIALGLPLQGLDETDPEWWAWGVAGWIVSLLLWGVLLLRQKAVAAGERTSVLADLKVAAIQLSRLIAVAALWLVAVAVALVPYGVGLQVAGLAGVSSAADVLKALALSPLTLPAAWLSVALMFAPLLVVLQKQGPLEAMLASLRLVRGNWWRASVVSGVAFAVLFVLLMVIAMIAGTLVGLAGVVDMKVVGLVAVPVGIVWSALSFAAMSAVLLALLGDLRVRQDTRPPGPPA